MFDGDWVRGAGGYDNRIPGNITNRCRLSYRRPAKPDRPAPPCNLNGGHPTLRRGGPRDSPLTVAGNAFFVDSALHSVGDSFLEASDGRHFYDAATSDKANSSLTRAFDLSGLSSAWLGFQLWRKL